MGEPLARTETGGEGVLADAVHRLEDALRTLEAALGRPGTGASEPASSAQVVELDAARRRSVELEAAATEASQALGRAAAEVQRALEEDEAAAADPQASLFDTGLFDGFDSPLESGAGLADDAETEATEPPSEKEPTA